MVVILLQYKSAEHILHLPEHNPLGSNVHQHACLENLAVWIALQRLNKMSPGFFMLAEPGVAVA